MKFGDVDLVTGIDGEETSFDQQKSRYTYDPAGNLISVQRADASYHIEYDVVYQPVRITATDGGIKHNIAIGFAYDCEGRVTQITNPSGDTHTFAYDRRQWGNGQWGQTLNCE